MMWDQNDEIGPSRVNSEWMDIRSLIGSRKGSGRISESAIFLLNGIHETLIGQGILASASPEEVSIVIDLQVTLLVRSWWFKVAASDRSRLC